MRVALLAALSAILIARTHAQSIPYLAPETARPAVGAGVKLKLTRANTDSIEHAFTLTAKGRTNRDDFSDRATQYSEAGAVYTGVQFADITVDSKDAGKWLREFGMMSRVATEMIVTRSAATMFRVGEGGEGTTAGRAGMKTEIRPLKDPTSLRGGDLGFRFYGHNQEAVHGATFRLTHIDTNETIELTTDQAGVAHLKDVKPGTWRVLAFALENSNTAPHLSIATLTFQVPPRSKS